MLRRVAVAVLAVLVMGSCSDAPESDDGPATPERAVEEWLAAVDAGDWDTTRSLIRESDLVILIAVDNALGTPEIEALLVNGISDSLRAEYWASFGANFGSISGVALAGVETGDVREFELRQELFASVELTVPGTLGSTSMLARQPGSGWTVDVIGTFGPQLVRPMRDIYRDARSANAEAVLEALRVTAPSLQAGLTLLGDDELEIDARAETETLIRLLGADS